MRKRIKINILIILILISSILIQLSLPYGPVYEDLNNQSFQNEKQNQTQQDNNKTEKVKRNNTNKKHDRKHSIKPSSNIQTEKIIQIQQQNPEKNIEIRNYYRLNIKTMDYKKNPILSTIEIEQENKKQIFPKTSSVNFSTHSKENLTITIIPMNPNFKALKITGKINKDTNLDIILPPSEFFVSFPIIDIQNQIPNLQQLNFSVKINKIVSKDYTIQNNKIIIPLLNKEEIIPEYGFTYLDNDEINNEINKTENFISSIELEFSNNKKFRNEFVSLKITPKLIRNRYPEYRRIVILENKLPNPYIPVFLLFLLLSIPSFYILYKRKEIEGIFSKMFQSLKIPNLNILDKIKVKLNGRNKREEKLSLKTTVSSNPKVADYILMERIGTGATSIVYKAQNIKNRSIVALKLIHKHLLSEPWFKERIQNEIEINKILIHPNIIRMLDYSLEEDQPFIAFEYIQGKSLTRILEEKKRLPLNEALEYWVQMLEALDYAHQKGIVHRDLKPDNIMIDLEKKQVKLTDFGISKKIDKTLNITQDFVGTPWYMSPEQIKNQKVDNRSDIYSLGVIVYQMLTGKLPFETSENIYAVFKAHMFDNPVSSNIIIDNSYIPPNIEKIIRKMLEKEPKKRYQYCYEIIQDLTPYLLTFSQK